MRVLVHFPQQREILPVPAVMVAGDLRGVTVRNAPRLLLELKPIVVLVVALDLVRRAGGSPQEAVGEAAGQGQAAALAAGDTMGGATYSQVFGVSPSRSSRSMPALS